MMHTQTLRNLREKVAAQETAQLCLFPDLELTSPQLKPQLQLEKREFTYVNQLQCALVRRHFLAARDWPSSDPFALKGKPPQKQLRALIFIVAICDRLNWDFVLGQLAARLSDMTDEFRPDAVATLSPAEFRRAFRGYQRPEGIKFTQKFRVVQAVAHYAQDTNVINQLLLTDRVQGKIGARAKILQIPAYGSDPLNKKCNALLHEIVRRRLIDFSDPDTIAPAIDYHIMRLYLRTGRVEIDDRTLSERLVRRDRVRIERITEIRQTVAEAMRYSAWLNGMSISSLNDLEWSFARKACRRDGVWCSGETGCPLESVCPSAKLSPFGMITEPESRHGHY